MNVKVLLTYLFDFNGVLHSLQSVLQKTMKVRPFANAEEKKTESLKKLNAILKNEYKNCFKNWKR